MDKRYLTTEEVADLCRTSPSTVRRWRYLGYGPIGARVGRRVLYPTSAVTSFIESQFEAGNS